MKLAFKRLGFGFVEKEVPIRLRIGTLEDVCEDFGIDFWQLDELKASEYDFNVELLYRGYLTACMREYRKPKYTKTNAIIWHEHMSNASKTEWTKIIAELMGKMTTSKPDKKKGKLK